MKSRKPPPGSPIRKYQRKATAARRIGSDQECHICGEKRPEALIAGSRPMICFACQRKKEGKSATDAHHPAGKSNSPVIVPLPVNDHRAELSKAQLNWPRETLENPNGSPLLAAAACIRGFRDTAMYLIEKLLVLIPDMLEQLNAFLIDKHGPNWWKNTNVDKFTPKR